MVARTEEPLAAHVHVGAVLVPAVAGPAACGLDDVLRVVDGAERDLVVEYGRRLAKPPRLSPSLRPLAVLAGLGAVALAEGGLSLLAGPKSALTALWIGMTGR